MIFPFKVSSFFFSFPENISNSSVSISAPGPCGDWGDVSKQRTFCINEVPVHISLDQHVSSREEPVGSGTHVLAIGYQCIHDSPHGPRAECLHFHGAHCWELPGKSICLHCRWSGVALGTCAWRPHTRCWIPATGQSTAGLHKIASQTAWCRMEDGPKAENGKRLAT